MDRIMAMTSKSEDTGYTPAPVIGMRSSSSDESGGKMSSNIEYSRIASKTWRYCR
jgi:hypothetical protein